MQKKSVIGIRRLCLAGVTGLLLSLSLDGNVIGANPAGNIEQPVGPAGVLGRVVPLRENYLSQKPGAKISEEMGTARLVGKNLAQGATAHASAFTAARETAALFGANANDIHPGATHLRNGANTVELMYDRATGKHRFTVVYFQQVRDGVPVFGARVSALVRNETGNPTVLINPDVRDLGTLRVNPLDAVAPASNASVRSAIKSIGGVNAQVISSRRVIFAGEAGQPYPATLADEQYIVDGHDEWLIVTDAKTGKVLYKEFKVCFGTAAGNVSGLASDGPGTDICEPEISKPIPYAQVNTGAGTVFTDANGNYSSGTFGATITALLNGRFFDVDNFLGGEASASTPAGNPANLQFNPAGNEQVQAQVNAYVEANVIRDFVVQFHPSYPEVGTRLDFPVSVNRTDGFCPQNAWYSPAERSINFCLSSGSAPNTAWSSVVYHEYGHHLVEAGGSGQGMYGEGSGDVMSQIILDEPCLGMGFFGNCSECLRNGDNTFQYPCSGSGHFCGQLISGCMWSVRNYLIVTNPLDYKDILGSLYLGSILLHSGSTITPQIAIDILTLDDDNGDLNDGTPHAGPIAQGFDDHSMLPAGFSEINFSFPNGRPGHVSPNGTSTVEFMVTNQLGTALPGSGTMFVNTGGGFVAASISQLGPNHYEATFPASNCGDTISYYVQAQATSGLSSTSPAGAPSESYAALSAYNIVTAFADNFESNLGWTVSSTASDGQWTRGVPVDGNRGDPPTDADGSGQCFVTDNVSGNSDVDSGSTTLTSPTMDASGGGFAVRYWRWFSNDSGDGPNNDPFTVQISSNNGSTWQNLEVVGPAGAGTSGGWLQVQYNLDDVPGFVQNNQFRIRYIAQDNDPQSIIEAGVDGVELVSIDCVPPKPVCPADLAGNDDNVDVNDLFLLLANFGTGGAGADLALPNDVVDVNDLFILLAAFGPCD